MLDRIWVRTPSRLQLNKIKIMINWKRLAIATGIVIAFIAVILLITLFVEWLVTSYPLLSRILGGTLVFSFFIGLTYFILDDIYG